MLSTNADFWPLFWALIGGGITLTVLATLVISAVPARRPQRPGPPTVLEGAAPGQGDTGQADSGKNLPAAA